LFSHSSKIKRVTDGQTDGWTDGKDETNCSWITEKYLNTNVWAYYVYDGSST